MEATLPPVSAERRWVAIEHVPYEGSAAIATSAADVERCGRATLAAFFEIAERAG
jgi:hypothetical protein